VSFLVSSRVPQSENAEVRNEGLFRCHFKDVILWNEVLRDTDPEKVMVLPKTNALLKYWMAETCSDPL
jgi:hypothetical protein